MSIRTHGAKPESWCVVAEWFGAERVVFEGDLFACLAYVSKLS